MKIHLIYFLKLIAILILGSVLIIFAGCPLWGSTFFEFTIENQTPQVLSVSVNTGSGVEVKPGEKLTEKYLRDTGKFKIVAKNSKGDIVYSKEFTLGDLDQLKFNVVIKQ